MSTFRILVTGRTSKSRQMANGLWHMVAVEALRTLPINLLDQVQCRGKRSESLEPPLTSLSTPSVNVLTCPENDRGKAKISSFILHQSYPSSFKVKIETR